MNPSTTLGSWLVHVMRATDGTLSFEEALHILMDSLDEYFPCQSAAVILIDDDTKELSVKISRHISYTFVKQFRRELTPTVEAVVLEQKPVLLNSLANDDARHHELIMEHEFTSAVVAPVVKNKRGVGYVYCDRSNGEQFSEADLLHLQVLGYIIGNLMEKFDLIQVSKKLSLTDDATNVFQYRTFVNSFALELERARTHDYTVGVSLISVDTFRNYLDTYGVDAAHALLADIAVIIKKHIRDVDLLARFGADQFILCLSGVTAEEADRKSSEILSSIAGHVPPKADIPIRITTGFLHLAGKKALSQSLQDIMAALGKTLVEAKRSARPRQ